MKRNYLLSDSIISPMGFGTRENLESIHRGRSALKFHKNSLFTEGGVYAGIIPDKIINESFNIIGDPGLYTKLEKLIILAIQEVLNENPDLNLQDTGLIISTTKGNIDQLGKNEFPEERLYLWKMAEVIASFFGFEKKPIVVSNACISGALAIKTANDLITAGRFSNALVAGGDLVSDFVLSGFQSFQAISPEPCRPFSNDRQGISLGEAAAAILIGPNGKEKEKIAYVDACTANDANHISGPSRTGEGLYLSISRLLSACNILPEEIGFLSAHGTATTYNDEMEAIAFHRTGLEKIPVNSFKGYYGHTLGTSALIETILTKHSLLNNELFASANFSGSGVSKPLNIIKQHSHEELKLALKTASGFGGCNLAMLLKKETDE
ncbi:MAG: beta-ketoacyl synthase N-terminal-like domain-containing protein [Christiangramia sp.]|nr:beta-ketoacyl synthase N-terminal-like domain-containing protein [Christiangramia sp.]